MKRAVVKLEVLATVEAPDDVIERLQGDYDNELDLWRDLAVSCVSGHLEEYHGTDIAHAQDDERGWVTISGESIDEEMYEGPEDVTADSLGRMDYP